MTSSFGPSQLVWNKVPYLKTLMWVWWVVLPLYVKTSIWSYSHIFFITYLFYFCRFLLLLLFDALTSNNVECRESLNPIPWNSEIVGSSPVQSVSHAYIYMLIQHFILTFFCQPASFSCTYCFCHVRSVLCTGMALRCAVAPSGAWLHLLAAIITIIFCNYWKPKFVLIVNYN